MCFDPVNNPCTTGIIFALTTSSVFAIVVILGKLLLAAIFVIQIKK
ncbi:Uncharacterised protein [Klebsiella pneumoniae]|uniref:Uncharacterized protein n=1 Tax=Klebsiella pneumoniae TaxID=573 RepID=A0A377XY19_KLEPN|nr:Uncharacterised protein [Klebsiella pneumoniae]